MHLTRHQIEHLMLCARANAIGLGLPAPRFPFPAGAVVTVHTHKDGVGDGVWFRLVDGRVFNCFAVQQDPSPEFYDADAVPAASRRAS